jgi:hypothetical protein
MTTPRTGTVAGDGRGDPDVDPEREAAAMPVTQ